MVFSVWHGKDVVSDDAQTEIETRFTTDYYNFFYNQL